MKTLTASPVQQASHAAATREGGAPCGPVALDTAFADQLTQSPRLAAQRATIQRLGADEEEPLQGRFAVVQREGLEEEEPLQGRFVAQREGIEDEEPLQGRFSNAPPTEGVPINDDAGLEAEADAMGALAMQAGPADGVAQRRGEATPNPTGLPDQLKSGVERLSGISLDHVRVHTNSSKPAQLNALAYAQGAEIHVGPGQERHLPHEAWHVVQQAQGRIRPTMQLKGGVRGTGNQAPGPEAEADGAMQWRPIEGANPPAPPISQPMDVHPRTPGLPPIQMEREYGYYSRDGKRKSPRVIIMEEFGDRNRIHNVTPDKFRERLPGDAEDAEIDKKTGIWRADEESRRPEDPPIYQPFRTAFHHLHNTLLSMNDVEGLTKQQIDEFTEKFTNIAKNAKKLSLAYKDSVRNTRNERDSMETAKGAYIAGLNGLINGKNGITALNREIMTAFTHTKQAPEGLRSGDMREHVEAEKQKRGEDIWRARWWAAVQKVNIILKRNWEPAKIQIKNWVKDHREHGEGEQAAATFSYMEESMVGDLDYIGSLAKGYKSPPKQYVRFMSEKFDVDGNLNAPPLAVYAINAGAKVDRGSVKAREYVKPMKDFEDAAWNELETVPGMDKGDKFEVFVRADGANELVTDGNDAVSRAQHVVSIESRVQSIKDRLWTIRAVNNDIFNDLRATLGEYLNEDGNLNSRNQGEVVNGSVPLNDQDLTLIEATIRRFEKQLPKEEEEEQ